MSYRNTKIGECQDTYCAKIPSVEGIVHDAALQFEWERDDQAQQHGYRRKANLVSPTDFENEPE
jgi:hypothetical protein